MFIIFYENTINSRNSYSMVKDFLKINVIENATKGEGRGRDQEGPMGAVKVLVIIY